VYILSDAHHQPIPPVSPIQVVYLLLRYARSKDALVSRVLGDVKWVLVVQLISYGDALALFLAGTGPIPQTTTTYQTWSSVQNSVIGEGPWLVRGASVLMPGVYALIESLGRASSADIDERRRQGMVTAFLSSTAPHTASPWSLLLPGGLFLLFTTCWQYRQCLGWITTLSDLLPPGPTPRALGEDAGMGYGQSDQLFWS
jgi:hypothetical protein